MAADDEIIVLDDLHDFQPTQLEIEQHASWLGIDIEFERDLLEIARSAILAPLPDCWRACVRVSKPEHPFYCNWETGASQWTHPLEDLYREKVRVFRARRKAYVLTLSLKEKHCGKAEVSATNLAGELLATIECDKGDNFGDIEDRLRKLVDAPDGMMLRLTTPDASRIGFSARAGTVADLFA